MENFGALNRPFVVLGLMSGTSLDGLDIAACRFEWDHSLLKWNHQIISADTIPYNAQWQSRLQHATSISAVDFVQLHAEYGLYLGEQVNAFVNKHQLTVDAIASHGHTIFHEPHKHIHFQIGNGAYIAAKTGLVTVSDFRTQDIALGGQGAPLVPIGDQLLFSDVNACLNLGGFANISFDVDGNRMAFDVAPCNIVLNRLAQQFDMPYDEDGKLARSGSFIPAFFEALNQLEYYQLASPKSLGYEWVEKHIVPIIEQQAAPTVDVLHTFCVHVAHQLALSIPKGNSVLATGGGVFNGFLLGQIKERVPGLIIPDVNTIQFKEALIFAFLGLLKLRGEINVLKSVTGSSINHCSGAVHSPFL